MLRFRYLVCQIFDIGTFDTSAVDALMNLKSMCYVECIENK